MFCIFVEIMHFDLKVYICTKLWLKRFVLIVEVFFTFRMINLKSRLLSK